jgi:DNA topoisomerase-1
MSQLVIVESPAKARTIAKFLGKGFVVKASMGHIRDLPKSQMGIDLETFEPEYLVSKEKLKVVAELAADTKKADTIILATDEDREGEAIAWHLLHALKLVKPKDKQVQRIAFHEITKEAILSALESPREIDLKLVDAQQARRVLDRLVGYELSPLIWKKIRYGLSAGRVQSVAVRLIVEREREIQAFKPEEYWSLTAEFETPRKDKFSAELTKIAGKKAEVTTKNGAEKVVLDLKGANFQVAKVDRKETRRYPAPPFTTSTLQQEASRKLGFSVKKTMMLAQRLYEGSDFGEGLITYMRTDSVNLAATAIQKARETIEKRFGREFVPPAARVFKTKAKGAQEAHEAIRPTDPARTPESLASVLEKDALNLYELIWQRLLACQMAEAVLDQTGVDVVAKDYNFRATGQIVKFPGFLKVYSEGRDSEEEAAAEAEKMLPEIIEGEIAKLLELLPAQHFTQPPARYTEATLVKKLESEGIGRPSTYAPTISTVIERGYVEKDGRALKPTDTGFVVNDFLVEHFAKIVDLKFTAKMEEELDEIAEGKLQWQAVMREFYGPFHKIIEEKEKSVKKGDAITDKTDEKCEKCGQPMEIKLGRFGKFLSCTGYPECKNARPLDKAQAAADSELQKEAASKTCPNCSKPLAAKRGRFGPFVACSGYPECKYIEKKVKKTGAKCPDCGGDIIEKFAAKRKKKFWGCEKYPTCKFASWAEPLSDPCPECGKVMIVKKDKKVCLGCGAERKAE